VRWGIRFGLLSVAFLLVCPGSAAAFGPLSSFGSYGEGAGQLRSPKQIALAPDGSVYVADSGNDRISVFTGDGGFLRTLVGQMSEPKDVALDSSDRLFVADYGDDRIDVFSPKGAFLFAFGAGKLNNPAGLALDSSTLYVADAGNDRVDAFTDAGAFLSSFGPISSPRDVIVGRDGNLYVADFGNERVDVFTEQGAFVRSFGDVGPGALSGPVSLVGDRAGGIYVADQAAQRVERFDLDGDYLGSFVAEPNVAGVAVACQGNVFAVEEEALLARVVRFGEPGTPPPPCGAGGPPPASPAPEPLQVVAPPSNKFRFAGLVKKRGSGRALLFVRVPGPGRLVLKGRGVRRLARSTREAMQVGLPVKPKVRLQHYLKRHGKGRIRVEVTFTPTGGMPRTREKVIALRRKRV
jgi:NHL repeat